MTRQVIVLIKNDGTVEVEHSGYVGNECLNDQNKLIEFLKKNGITGTLESQEMKQETMFASEETEQVRL
jgi:hypothetical protein